MTKLDRIIESNLLLPELEIEKLREKGELERGKYEHLLIPIISGKDKIGVLPSQAWDFYRSGNYTAGFRNGEFCLYPKRLLEYSDCF